MTFALKGVGMFPSGEGERDAGGGLGGESSFRISSPIGSDSISDPLSLSLSQSDSTLSVSSSSLSSFLNFFFMKDLFR